MTDDRSRGSEQQDHYSSEFLSLPLRGKVGLGTGIKAQEQFRHQKYHFP